MFTSGTERRRRASTAVWALAFSIMVERIRESVDFFAVQKPEALARVPSPGRSGINVDRKKNKGSASCDTRTAGVRTPGDACCMESSSFIQAAAAARRVGGGFRPLFE